MKVAAIFLVSCILFSLLPSNFSQGLIKSYLRLPFCSSYIQINRKNRFLLLVKIGEETRLTGGERRPWCPSKKQVFSGSCTNDRGQQCLNDLLNTWDQSVRLSPISCTCTTLSNNMRLCNCPNMICP
ncbi:unnamed protein product [Cochlearia groenlandica]